MERSNSTTLLAAVNQETRVDRKLNSSHLTGAEKVQINRQQNRLSKTNLQKQRTTNAATPPERPFGGGAGKGFGGQCRPSPPTISLEVS
jgi:hypothetical protein